jgi:dimethylsulfoniopropionate demethylase
LQRIAEQGHQREIRGVMFDGGPGPACGKPWPVMAGDQQVGQITSAMWSPRLERNVGLSMIARSHWAPGQAVSVHCADGVIRPGEVCALPFA